MHGVLDWCAPRQAEHRLRHEGREGSEPIAAWSSNLLRWTTLDPKIHISKNWRGLGLLRAGDGSLEMLGWGDAGFGDM